MDARGLLENSQRDPAGPEKLLFPAERDVLADHDRRYAVQKNGPAAHGAGRERCIEDRLAIYRGRLAPGLFQSVNLGVKRGTSLLYASIVAATEDSSLV